MGVFYLVSLWWSRDGPNPVLYSAFICVNRSGALFFLCTFCRQLVGQIIFLFSRCFLFANTDPFVFFTKGVVKTQNPTPVKPCFDPCRTCSSNQS